MNETYQSRSSLLIDEPPMLMLPSLAKVLKSADKAIIVQQIHYWLQIKRKAKDTRSFKEGRWWVYNSFREWHKQFIWISERTIQRHFKDLVAQGIIIVGNFNNQNYDRTNWYTLSYERLNELTMTDCRNHYDGLSYPSRQVDVMDNDKLSGVSRQVVRGITTDCRDQYHRLPETTSKIISKTSSSSAYSTNSEYIHSSTTASQLADDDAGRTQPGQSLAQSAATASSAQPQQSAIQPQRQPQPSGWTEPADPTGPDSLADPNGMNQIFRIWADLWSWPNSTTIADLTAWVKDFGPDVVLYAIKKAATADASRPHAYMAAIIRGYRSAGIKTLDEVKAADQAREQRSQQQSYGRPQYNNGNRGSRANVQEQLPDWAKQDDDEVAKPKTAEQLDGERLERDLHRAVMLQQQLYGVDLTAICHNLDQPDGHGYLSAKASKLFEKYCEQNHLDVAEQIKKARETADFS